MPGFGVIVGAVASRTPSYRSFHSTGPCAEASVMGLPIRIDGIARLPGSATDRSSATSGLALLSPSVSVTPMRSPAFQPSSGASSEIPPEEWPTAPYANPDGPYWIRNEWDPAASSLTTRLDSLPSAQLTNSLLLGPSSTKLSTRLSGANTGAGAGALPATTHTPFSSLTRKSLPSPSMPKSGVVLQSMRGAPPWAFLAMTSTSRSGVTSW